MPRRLAWIWVGVTAPVAVLLLCCGVFGGGLLPWLLDEDAARVQRLTPISAVRLEDSPPGSEAMIEGIVSRRNSLSGAGFVAYTRFVARRDEDGNLTWKREEEVRPPLLVDLPDGTVQVTGAYSLYDPAARETQGDERLVGLRVGDPLLAVGRLVEGRESIELEADFVAGVGRNEFLESQRAAGLFFRYSGAFVGACGTMLLIGAIVAAVLLIRKRPAGTIV